MLEGGGQLFRMTIALAYIMSQPVQIFNIRKNRYRGGGLGNQHLTGLQGVVNLVPGSKVKGNFKKSTEVSFRPGDGIISRLTFEADCGSPGSVALIL